WKGLEVRAGGGCLTRKDSHEATQKRLEQKALIVLEGSRAGRSPMTVAFVCLVPLTCRAPEIVEAILDGRQRRGSGMAELLGSRPLQWTEQPFLALRCRFSCRASTWLRLQPFAFLKIFRASCARSPCPIGGAVVADDAMRQADHDRREGCAPRTLRSVPSYRGQVRSALFAEILRRIDRLRPRPPPLPASASRARTNGNAMGEVRP
ncbi:MAG: hypothetical protein K0S35_1038, partial [Geminicoccaceae bacterium]|nr:hypothetical protein [Geminicoccaceae bacterium]